MPVFLSGPIDAVPDHGLSWREDVTGGSDSPGQPTAGTAPERPANECLEDGEEPESFVCAACGRIDEWGPYTWLWYGPAQSMFATCSETCRKRAALDAQPKDAGDGE